jgi:GAF domain-containing protein
LAEQAAAAREKGYLADQLRARAEELALLNEMGASLAAARDLESVMETIYRDTSRLLDTTNLYIARYDGETGEVRFPIVVEGKQRQPATLHRRASGLAEFVMRSGEPLLIEENLPDRLGALGVTEAEPLPVSWVGVPIKAGDRVLGVLALQNYERAHHFDARDGDLLLAIANQAAIALENIRLFDESQAALAEVEKTHRSYLHAAWQDHLRGRRGLSTGGLVYERPASPERALAGAGPSATVAARKPAAADVANVPDLWRPEMERALKSGFSGPAPEGGGGLAVPITLRGQTLGVLGVELPEGGRQWTEDDLALVQAVSEQLAQTLETARLFADTQRSAERERLIGEITSRVRASTDVRAILETAAVELGRALGTSRALVRLATDALPEGPEGTLPGGLVAGQGHEATAAAPTGGSLKGNAVGEDAEEEV